MAVSRRAEDRRDSVTPCRLRPTPDSPSPCHTEITTGQCHPMIERSPPADSHPATPKSPPADNRPTIRRSPPQAAGRIPVGSGRADRGGDSMTLSRAAGCRQSGSGRVGSTRPDTCQGCVPAAAVGGGSEPAVLQTAPGSSIHTPSNRASQPAGRWPAAPSSRLHLTPTASSADTQISHVVHPPFEAHVCRAKGALSVFSVSTTAYLSVF